MGESTRTDGWFKWTPAGLVPSTSVATVGRDSTAYECQSKDFVKGAHNGTIAWGFQGKHGRDVANGITIGDVRWILPHLSRITRDQMIAGLIASGASPETAQSFRTAMRSRIDQLERIAGTFSVPTD